MRSTITAKCGECGGVFNAVAYEIRRGGGKFCSRKCQRANQARINAAAMKSSLSLREMRLRWKKNTPLSVHRAHDIVEREVLAGRLSRRPCGVCGIERVDAHHDDYNQPLNVLWLCRKHHIARHKLLSSG